MQAHIGVIPQTHLENLQELKAAFTEEAADRRSTADSTGFVTETLQQVQLLPFSHSCNMKVYQTSNKKLVFTVDSIKPSVLTLQSRKHSSATHYELSYNSEGNCSVKVFTPLYCKCFF